MAASTSPNSTWYPNTSGYVPICGFDILGQTRTKARGVLKSQLLQPPPNFPLDLTCPPVRAQREGAATSHFASSGTRAPDAHPPTSRSGPITQRAGIVLGNPPRLLVPAIAGRLEVESCRQEIAGRQTAARPCWPGKSPASPSRCRRERPRVDWRRGLAQSSSGIQLHTSQPPHCTRGYSRVDLVTGSRRSSHARSPFSAQRRGPSILSPPRQVAACPQTPQRAGRESRPRVQAIAGGNVHV